MGDEVTAANEVSDETVENAEEGIEDVEEGVEGQEEEEEWVAIDPAEMEDFHGKFNK